jgi:hypothetical protein
VIDLNQSPHDEVAVDLQSGPLFSETTYIKAYEALEAVENPQSRKKSLFRIAAGTAVAGALTGVYLMLHTDKGRLAFDTAPPLSLTLATKGPELLVSWTGGIANPKQAQLRVMDGDSVDQIDMTSTFKPDHSLILQRHSGNIQATLVVSDGYRRWQTQSSLIDPAAAVGRASELALNRAERAELNNLREENDRFKTRAAAGRRTRRGRR